MQPNSTSREAKEFLIACVVSEAQREGVSLSETEGRMLYFTETAWCPFDFVDLNDAFERECNPEEYEDKIASLAESFRKHAKRVDRDRLAEWNRALRLLKGEDHYLLILISAPQASVGIVPFQIFPGISLRTLVLSAIGFTSLWFAVAYLLAKS